ncbi:biosynthetic peptidoglycan transglycosylase [Bacteroides cellulosilyticus]|uniref:Penicillin-binding protein n=1 Tax=Bacteroides cellulosilyticus TaxID=246787 RepID=A0A6L3K8B5_9BACE|nr:biosynthetic peptidoglycan transglycosylase [Bacteroides cellulosilyticus]KAA5422544.1 penicillin-binding protein [Bacteroides cellulosilyticus]
MIKRKITKVIVACLMLLFLLSTGIFIFRGSLLRHIADKRITRLEQRYGLDISYNKLHMKGLNTISIDGLNVVPQKRDTLLSLQSLNIRIGLWKLLWGDIKIKEVRLDGLSLNFIKKDSTANYDFLFLPSSEVTASNESNTSTDYTRRINTTLNLLFGLLPGNGELTHLTITERKDRNFVSFRIPRFVIDDDHFQSEITVLEDSLNQQWNTEGEFNPSERRLHATLHASQLAVPYIHRRFGAEVQFDSLTCNFSQEKTNNGLTCLVGQSEVRGLQVYHKRLSPETINLDRGQLDFHVNVSPQAVELDSTSLVRFNALTFHPYLKAERIGKSTDKKEWHFIASVRKPWFPSEELFGSLPKGLFENLEGLGTTGQLAYHFLLDVDFSQLDNLKFESELKEKDFRILHYGKTDLGKMSDEFIYTAYENGQPVYTFPVGPSWENFTPLDSISPLLQMSVMQSEDGAFFYHRGFLPDAMREALIHDLEVRKFARGGSTISMQLVKNVFLNRNKNIARKLEEALIVWLIETEHLTPKARMYEVYLNIAEWGPMVYGIHEAASFYFNKRPSQLSLEESIFLASIVPKPKHFKNSFTADGRLQESQEGYFRLIAERLAKKEVITDAQAAQVNINNVVLKGVAKSSFVSESWQ